MADSAQRRVHLHQLRLVEHRHTDTYAVTDATYLVTYLGVMSLADGATIELQDTTRLASYPSAHNQRTRISSRLDQTARRRVGGGESPGQTPGPKRTNGQTDTHAHMAKAIHPRYAAVISSDVAWQPPWWFS